MCAGIAHSFCVVYTYYVWLDRSLSLAAVGYHTTVTVLSVLLSLVMTLSFSTCADTKTWWVVQHPSAVPVPSVEQGCCLPPCRGRGQCQSRSRRGGATNRGEGGGGWREDAGQPSLRTCPLRWATSHKRARACLTVDCRGLLAHAQGVFTYWSMYTHT